MATTFLSPEDVATLTGCKIRARQIEALKRMRLPFFVNARGVPVVPSSAINGSPAPAPKKTWSPPA